MIARANVKNGVIAASLNPIDLIGRNESRLRSAADKKATLVPTSHFPWRRGLLFALEQTSADTSKRFSQARRRDRFEQIIDRAGFEGVHGMSIKRRHENNRRSVCRVKAFHNVKSIGARHLNVEQKKIRRILFDRGNRLRGVAAFRDDFYFASRASSLCSR